MIYGFANLRFIPSKASTSFYAFVSAIGIVPVMKNVLGISMLGDPGLRLSEGAFFLSLCAEYQEKRVRSPCVPLDGAFEMNCFVSFDRWPLG